MIMFLGTLFFGIVIGFLLGCLYIYLILTKDEDED